MTLIKLLSLRSRFLLAPIVAGLLMMSLYFVQSYEFEQKKTSLTELQKSNLPVVGEISRITMLMAKNQHDLHQAVELAKLNNLETFFNHKDKVLRKLFEIENAFEKLMQNDFKNPMQPFIKEMFTLYYASVLEAIELAEIDLEQAEAKLFHSSESLGEINQLLIGLSNHFITQLTIQSVKQEKSFTNTWLPILIFLTIGITIFAGLMMSNKMSSDLNKYNQSLKSLSFGNLEVTPPETNDPYFKDIEKSIISFKQALQNNQQQKASLEESRQRYQTLLNFVPTAIITLDKDQNITLFNQSAELLFRAKADDLIGESITTLLPEIETQKPFTDSKQLPESLQGHRPYQATRLSGEQFLAEINQTKLEVIYEELTTLAITDVTERHEAEEKIWNQAHYDALTELPNRRYSINSLDHTLKLAKRNQQKVAVLFIDLDNFKKINDTLGHAIGDAVLVEASKRLDKLIRQTDMVGRLSGDEFVVILNHLNEIVGIERILEKLVQSFRVPISAGNRELITTLSVGVAIYPDDADNKDELLKKADIAMYHAKESGRNGYAFYQKNMNKRIQRRIDIEHQLRHALINNEFEVFYQCQHNVANKEILGVEALVRWQNPELGSVSPKEFIPIAEQTGQIHEISEFVMLNAIQQLQSLHRQVPEKKLVLSVNLSPVQLRDPNLLATIDQILNTFGMNARYLNLEITEGTLITGHESTAELLNQFKYRGMSISIDDFGTGYSSLSYLQKFSFDYLKIDRSFVKDCMSNMQDQHLIKAIIAMAHALNMKVVVEGVETLEQLNFIIDAKGDAVQGYYFCEPKSPKDLTAFLIEHLNQINT